MLIFYSDGGFKENKSIDNVFVKTLGSRGQLSYLSINPQGDKPWYEKWKIDRKRAGFRKLHFFGITSSTSKKDLANGFSSDAIFLPGGNTFEILAQMKRLRLLDKIKKFYERGRIVSGLSAGAMIMTPTIRTAELVPDDRGDLLKNDRALNFVSFEVLPHFKNTLKQKKALISYSKRHSTRVFAIPDGSGIVCDEDSLSLHGDVTCFDQGKSIGFNS